MTAAMSDGKSSSAQSEPLQTAHTCPDARGSPARRGRTPPRTALADSLAIRSSVQCVCARASGPPPASLLLPV